MIIFASTQGYLDEIPVAHVTEFNALLRDYLGKHHPEIGARIAETKELAPETEALLRKAIEHLKETWKDSGADVIPAAATA